MVSLAMSAASVRFSNYAENLFRIEDQGQSDMQSESLDIYKNVSAFEGSVQCPWIVLPYAKKSGNCHHHPNLQKKSCDKRKWKIVDGKSQMLIEGEPRSAGTQTTTTPSKEN